MTAADRLSGLMTSRSGIRLATTQSDDLPFIFGQWAKWTRKAPSERMMLMRGIIALVTVSAAEVMVSIDRDALLEQILAGSLGQKPSQSHASGKSREEANCSTITIPFELTRRGGQARIVSSALPAQPVERNMAVIKMIARAHHWFEEFRTGKSTQQIAAEAGFDRSYIAQVMPLVFLAPDIVESVMAARIRLTIRDLLLGSGQS